MKNARREAFWGYTNGERRHMSELLPQAGIIFQEIKSGEAVMQYELPIDGKQDAVVWKPGKEQEQQARDQARISKIRDEIKTQIAV